MEVVGPPPCECLQNLELAINHNEAANCDFGFEEDPCGYFFCLKGPQGWCGGHCDTYGKCGPGTSCNKCNRCTGCSTEQLGNCWDDEDCTWTGDDDTL